MARSATSLRRVRRLVCAALAASVLALAAAPAQADDPAPDKIGAFQTTPNAASVPGYTKPDPEKATTKELAVARRRRRAVGLAQLLLDQLRLGAGRRLPRHLHAGRLRARRDRPHPRQERRAHHVDELHRLRARHVRLLRVRLRVHVRRLQRHRHRRPGHARRRADAEPHVHGRLVGQRRPRLGPLRHHRLLPDRRRLRRRAPSSCSCS